MSPNRTIASRSLARFASDTGASGSRSSGPALPSSATAAFTGDVGACPGYDPCRPDAVECPATLALTGLCPGAGVAPGFM